MEQAVNMFTGGMVLDSHPLVQSSDTLSDALNATYITMNGNEVVLQNDMGNRRVDNAYLPAGYEPVGIKEHGGIIYIAAYNPITHRSQIGSFPSPERNMGIEYKDNGTSFNLSNFIESENIVVRNGIKYLKDDILLLPLTNDTSLHAGDKFTVYSGEVWNWGNNGLLTNFGTENLGIPQKYNKTPFNSYFTLSLGIVNSQNEFSDITNSLERFDSSGNIIKGLDIDENKFNTGYFIAPGAWEDVNESIINEREKIGANTYAYKLTGPLYLKAELNHIQTFSYSMNMSKTPLEGGSTFKIDLYITGTAVYNCPDSNDVNPYFDSFKLFYKNLDLNSLEYTKYSEENNNPIISQETRTFDSTTGLYTSTITKHFIFTLNISHNSDVLEYLIAVPIFHKKQNMEILDNNQHTLDEYNIFISGLSEAGSLDISKIGTNECELGMWKYRNNVENGEVTSTLLDYRFDCYRDQATTFKDLQIQLINQTNTGQNPFFLNDIISIPDEISTGRQEFSIDWTAVEQIKRINFQDLYLVKITYNQYTEGQAQPSSKTIYRFILGTELFNPCYNESNKDYTSDFGIFMGNSDSIPGFYSYQYSADNVTQNIPIPEGGNTLRNKYLNLENKLDIMTDPILIESLKSKTIIGTNPISLTEPQDQVYHSGQQFEKTINVKYNTTWKITNPELYPTNVVLTNTTTSVGISDIEKKVNTNKNYTSDLQGQAETFDNDVFEGPSSIANQNQTLSFDILLKDLIYFTQESTTKTIGKAYTNLSASRNDHQEGFHNSVIQNLISRNQSYNGIGGAIDTDDPKWAGYRGYINGSNLYDSGTEYNGSDDYHGTLWMNAFQYYDDFEGTYTSLTDFWGALKDSFKTKMQCPFTFMLHWEAYFYGNKDEIMYKDGDYYQLKHSSQSDFDKRAPANEYARVWWADEDGNPVLLNNYSNNDHTGLFYTKYTGAQVSNDEEKRENIYLDILNFIGSCRVKASQYIYDIGYLVVPLENYYLKAWFPKSSSYLYSENTSVDLSLNVNYTLTPPSDGNIIASQGENCLNFYTNISNSIVKTKSINKTLNVNTEHSQNIFDFSQQSDLSNYSIDLDTGLILSKNDPLKRLYIRKGYNSTILKEVPKNYPIQINTGTKYEFPVVCKKRYSTNINEIGSNIMVIPANRTILGNVWYFENTYSNNTVARAVIQLHPSSQQIPVLYEEDLIINDEHFFDT